MTIKSKYLKVLSFVCAAVFMIAALSVCASAAPALSIQEIQAQMAANSAAWWVAHNAGDAETCAALEEANQDLAVLLAYGGGSAVFDTATGTWKIETASGTTVSSSSGGSNGKTNSVDYTSVTSDGSISMNTGTSYTDSSINTYYQYGGTDQGLQTSYNNAADRVSTSGDYGDQVAVTSAEAEVAVAKKLLGLTDAQARKLQADLELSKQAYEAAQTQYDAAVASGDTATAEEAMEKMIAAHDAAQDSRARYNYTGDSAEVNDGGYYYGDSGHAGGWFIINLTHTYDITAKVNEGGSITPSGTVSVKEGSDQTFTITPDKGYKTAKILVDDKEVEVAESYTFENVKETHTIDVTFEKTELAITASAGSGGSITPTGIVKVEYGESKAFTIHPDEGYEIDKVLIDGVDMGPITSYTFPEVKEEHTISASFIANGFVKLGSTAVTDSMGASLSGGSIKSGYGIMVNVPLTAEGVDDVKVTVTYNFGSGKKTVTLAHSGDYYVFPRNIDSPTGARCVYIPVEAKDATYTLTIAVTATDYAGNAVSDTGTARVTVKGSMYEDDFTGDS